MTPANRPVGHHGAAGFCTVSTTGDIDRAEARVEWLMALKERLKEGSAVINGAHNRHARA
jgi:hypothetical protein